jgi:hypothetical protein
VSLSTVHRKELATQVASRMDRSRDTIAPLGPEGRILKAALAVVAVERSQHDHRNHAERRSEVDPDWFHFHP